MLERARAFFKQRDILEVDCPSLVPRAPIDANIDVISAQISDTETAYLHTSPEYAMKKLLSMGSGDIYYLGHVFRKGELGKIHNPEFTMAEWYRTKLTFLEMIQETAEFLFLFFGPLPIRHLSYQEAFLSYTGIDPFQTTLEELQRASLPFSPPNASWDKETYRHLLLTHAIEPKLGFDELTVLMDYPPNEAALAKTTLKNGLEVAERFEIYYQGVELTNGYHELADAKILKKRFEEENRTRVSQNKEPYLLDEIFLAAMDGNFPPCCGVSVGFDRALMLKSKERSIHTILSLPNKKGTPLAPPL